jgi:hypothetical protein
MNGAVMTRTQQHEIVLGCFTTKVVLGDVMRVNTSSLPAARHDTALIATSDVPAQPDGRKSAPPVEADAIAGVRCRDVIGIAGEFVGNLGRQGWSAFEATGSVEFAVHDDQRAAFCPVIGALGEASDAIDQFGKRIGVADSQFVAVTVVE